MNSTKTIPKEWKKVRFVDCIDLSSLKKLKGLKKSEYKDEGKYFILDQGQDFVSGYTDNIEFVNKKYPAILFGDHTRIVKFINFPFVVGADGTKIFQSKKENNPKFLYYSLLNLNIPNTGYNRHFKLVKESKILIPTFKEQTKIAGILSSVDEEIEKVDQEIKKTEELKMGLMSELLTKGIGHKKFKKTKLGELPVEWEVKKIGDLGDIVTGGTPKTNNKEYWDGDIRWMSSGEVNLKKVYDTEKRITKLGLKNSNARLLPKGTVMIALAGQGKTRGKVAVLEVETSCNQSLAGIIADQTKINNLFLFYNLGFRYQEIRNINGSNGRAGLNLKLIKDIVVPVAAISEQIKIVNILSSVDDKILVNKQIKNKLAELKRGLMQDLLSGRVRV